MTNAGYDAIVIGAGTNGLAAAVTLARAGRRVLVLEEQDDIGGLTRPVEFAPGFRAPLSEDCGWCPPGVERALQLDSSSLARAKRAMSVSVAAGEGPREMFSIWSDPRDAAVSIRPHSERDAIRWPAFVERLHKFEMLLRDLYAVTPPDIDTKSPRELFSLAMFGRKLRALGKEDMTEFLRVMPMSIQDLLDDTFESELLKGAIASGAIRDLQQGPRSGGTAYNLLHYIVGALRGSVRGRSWFVSGPDAFARAAAESARRLGVTIRTDSRVARVLVRDYAVSGVLLDGGGELAAPLVISSADPVRTFLQLVESLWLDPEFLLAVRNVKLRGCTAFVHYALDRLPEFGGSDDATLKSSVSLTADMVSLERAADAAKYGESSARPHVEFFVPTARWPSLAPAGKHVLTARAQYAPYQLKNGNWDDTRSCKLADSVTSSIAGAIPGFADRVLQRAVLTPRDLEQRYGVTEGALTHGELMLDQILFMRPVPGWGRYETPITGLYFGGSGAHPGPGIHGAAGYLAARRALARKR